MKDVLHILMNQKINRLGVNPNTLKIHGAVSEETAREMAEGIAKKFLILM